MLMHQCNKCQTSDLLGVTTAPATDGFDRYTVICTRCGSVSDDVVVTSYASDKEACAVVTAVWNFAQLTSATSNDNYHLVNFTTDKNTVLEESEGMSRVATLDMPSKDFNVYVHQSMRTVFVIESNLPTMMLMYRQSVTLE